ncbi:unnamed protein product [Allacma fusca]|uniref:Uncharacterized protein n=1 Tax=Allacma fusca TaxID=39272 RepID=A0A8J2KK61_9HEXA|nr:unnamed protein product [Allacma fusca]
MRVARTEDIPSIIRRPYEESVKESTMVNGFAKTCIFLSSIGASHRNVFTDDDFTAESSGNVQTPGPSDNEDEDDNGGNNIPNPEEIVIAEDFNMSNDAYQDIPEDMRSNSNRCEPSIDVQFRESPALPDNLRDNEPAGPSNATTLTHPKKKIQRITLLTNSINENIILGINKAVGTSENIEAIVLKNPILDETNEQAFFDLTPWDVYKNSVVQEQNQPQSTRKRRPRQVQGRSYILGPIFKFNLCN